MSNERAVTVSRGQVEMRAGGGKEGKVERKGEKERKNVEMRAEKKRKKGKTVSWGQVEMRSRGTGKLKMRNV